MQQSRGIDYWTVFSSMVYHARQLARILKEKDEEDLTEAAIDHVISHSYLEATDGHGTSRQYWLGPGTDKVGSPTEEQARRALRVVICFSDESPPEAPYSARAAKDMLRIQPGYFSREDRLLVMTHQDLEEWFTPLERALTFIHLAHLVHSDSIVDAWSAKLDLMELVGGDAWQAVLRMECAALRCERSGHTAGTSQLHGSRFYFRDLHAAFDTSTQCANVNPYVEDCRRTFLSMAARVALDTEKNRNRPAAIERNSMDLRVPLPARVRSPILLSHA